MYCPGSNFPTRPFFGCPHLGNLVVTLSPTEKFVRELDVKCPKVDCSYLISAWYTGLISLMPNFSSTTCNTEKFNTSLERPHIDPLEPGKKLSAASP